MNVINMIREYEKPQVENLARSIMNEYRAALGMDASEQPDVVVNCLYAVDKLQQSQATKDALSFAETCYDILIKEDYSFIDAITMDVVTGMQALYNKAKADRPAIRAGAQAAARIVAQDYATPVINDYFRAMGEEPYQLENNGRVSRRVSHVFHPDGWSDYDITPEEHGFVEQAFKDSFRASEVIEGYHKGSLKDVLLAYAEIRKIRTASSDYVAGNRAKGSSAARKRKENKTKAKEEPKKEKKNNANAALEREMEQDIEKLVRSKMELPREGHYFALDIMFGHDMKYAPIHERVQGTIRKVVDNVYDSIYPGFEGYKKEAEKKAAESAVQGGEALKYAGLFEETGDVQYLNEALNNVKVTAEDYAEAFERTGDIRFLEEALKALKG